MKLDAVIVAAGSSTRFGDGDKLLADLCGRPLLAWSLVAYEESAAVERIVLVVAAGRLAEMESLGRAWAPSKLACVVPGGERRRDSVEAGLRVCRSRYVAIHDGARPLVSTSLIEACVAAAERGPGAIPAIAVTDTIKIVRHGQVVGHPDRASLWAAQTPQVVLRQAWLDAAAASDGDETDDAAMLGRLGLDVAVVEGDPENVKVTRPADLELARQILAGRRRP